CWQYFFCSPNKSNLVVRKWCWKSQPTLLIEEPKAKKKRPFQNGKNRLEKKVKKGRKNAPFGALSFT
ncbi:MAG: hypothetical protein ACRDCC_03625, partial [Culicoidibacterales bacterium]